MQWFCYVCDCCSARLASDDVGHPNRRDDFKCFKGWYAWVMRRYFHCFPVRRRVKGFFLTEGMPEDMRPNRAWLWWHFVRVGLVSRRSNRQWSVEFPGSYSELSDICWLVGQLSYFLVSDIMACTLDLGRLWLNLAGEKNDIMIDNWSQVEN